MSFLTIKIINGKDDELKENITMLNDLNKDDKTYVSILKIKFDDDYRYCYEHEFDSEPPIYYFVSIYTGKDIKRIQKKGRKLLFKFIDTSHFEESGYSLNILNEIYDYKYTKCYKCNKILDKKDLQNHIKKNCVCDNGHYGILLFDIDIYYKWFITTENIKFMDVDKNWDGKTFYENIVR
jgi:hypothetical protein